MSTKMGVNAPGRPVTVTPTSTPVLATVVGYLPDDNLYYLELKYKVTGATKFIYASGPVAMPGSSASSIPVYAAGDVVHVLIDLTDSTSNGYKYTIIGRASDIDTPDTAPSWSFLPYIESTKSIWTGIQGMWNAIKAHIPGAPEGHRQHTAPLNLLPGDSFTGSVQGPSVLTGKHVQLVGIPNYCYTVWDDINYRKQEVAHEISSETPCESTYVTLSGTDYFKESYTASDIYEGFGYTTEAPEEQSEYYMIPRKVTLEGSFVEGSYSALTVPSEGVNTEQFSVQSTPVAYDYIMANGERYSGSASSILIQKSPFMALPHRIGELPNGTFTALPEEPEDYGALDETALSVASVRYEENAGYVYRGGVDANQDTWTMQEANQSELSKQMPQEGPSYEVSGTETYDKLPDLLTLTDPKTGTAKTYYASSAFFQFLPDGSIVLADGYGSEIRMYRGNIYISPKADLICTSGRDTMMMSGRTTAIKGYKRVQINSTTSDVYIKAEEHMRLLSGASGVGYLTVENRSQDPTKGGLILRGNHSVGLTAQNIYIGLTTGKDVTEGQLDTQATGSIVVNAGRGSVSINGTAVHATGSDVTLAGYNNMSGMGSVFSLQSTQAVLNCSTAVVSATGLAFGPVDTPLSIQGVSYDGELITITGFSAQGNSEMIQIDGHVQLTGSVRANGQIVSNTGMYSRQGGFVNANPEYSGMAIRDEGFNNITIETASVIVPVNLDSAWTTHINGVAQSNILTGERFIYPTSEELGINPGTYDIPGMRWQAFMKDATVWTEKELVDPIDKDTSMVYPGKEAWEQGTITIGTEDDPTRELSKNFTINAVKE